MDYLKDVWKISGKLKWYEYITVGSIVYGLIILIAIIMSIFSGPYTFRDVLEIPLVIIIFGGFAFINIRFNPFISNSIRDFLSNTAKKSKENFKKTYNEEIANGPKTTTTKINPFGGDYTIKESTFGDHYNVQSNWETKTESDLEVKARALNNAAVMGAATPVMEGFFGFVLMLIKWPFSFILAPIKLRSAVKQYRRDSVGTVGNNSRQMRHH